MSEKEKTGERQNAELQKVMLQGADLNNKLEEFCLKTEEGDFACTECKKKFKKRRKLLFHAEIHLDMTHPCIVCEKVFRTRNVLATHYTREHPKQVSSPWTMQ